ASSPEAARTRFCPRPSRMASSARKLLGWSSTSRMFALLDGIFAPRGVSGEWSERRRPRPGFPHFRSRDFSTTHHSPLTAYYSPLTTHSLQDACDRPPVGVGS